MDTRPLNPAYIYQARVTSIYDADTITVDIDLGLHAHLKGEKLRLYGINAPEVRGEERPEGLVARDYLRDMLLDRDCLIVTLKDKSGKYGRYLAKVWLGDIYVNGHLVEQGYAEWKDYERR